MPQKPYDVYYEQPRPQGFSLKKWVGEGGGGKAPASAGHVSPRTP